MHPVALWHRYSISKESERLSIFGDAKKWCGLNFAYIYWLRGKQQLMPHARFKVCKYPTKADLKIWTEDEHGRKERMTPEFAKTIELLSLKTNRKSKKDMRSSDSRTCATSAGVAVQLRPDRSNIIAGVYPA